MIKTIFFAFSLAILFCASAYAQPTFFIADQELASTSTEVVVPVQVSDFDGIASLQFSINWDPTVLSLGSIGSEFGLEEVSLDANFGQTNVNEGKISFSWYESNFETISLDDNTALFTLNFNVVGGITETTVSEIEFTSDPTAIEVTNGNDILDSVVFDGGEITLEVVSSVIYNNAPDLITVNPCTPNPIKNTATLTFELANAMDVELTIVDQQGRQVSKESRSFFAGHNSISIDKDDFASSGIYYLELSSKLFKTSQKVLFIEH